MVVSVLVLAIVNLIVFDERQRALPSNSDSECTFLRTVCIHLDKPDAWNSEKPSRNNKMIKNQNYLAKEELEIKFRSFIKYCNTK